MALNKFKHQNTVWVGIEDTFLASYHNEIYSLLVSNSLWKSGIKAACWYHNFHCSSISSQEKNK